MAELHEAFASTGHLRGQLTVRFAREGGLLALAPCSSAIYGRETLSRANFSKSELSTNLPHRVAHFVGPIEIIGRNDEPFEAEPLA